MSAMEETRRRRPWLLTAMPALIFAVLAAAFYWGLVSGDDRLPSALVSKPVPQFDLPPIEGRRDGLSTADLKGRFRS